MPRLRHVSTCHHQVGRVCTTEAVRAVDAVIKGAARRIFVLHASGWPQRLLVLLSGLGSRPTQQAQLKIYKYAGQIGMLLLKVRLLAHGPPKP